MSDFLAEVRKIVTDKIFEVLKSGDFERNELFRSVLIVSLDNKIISRDELCTKFLFSKSTISRWVSDKGNPSKKVRKAILKFIQEKIHKNIKK